MAGIFQTEIGLALGGGGARGGAHIGVLRVLSELDYRPDLIVGTSIGGLMAIALGTGWDHQGIEDYIRSLEFNELLALNRTGDGLITNAVLREQLHELFGDADLRDLSPTIAVVATDVRSGDRIIIDKGPVVKAALATSAVPGLFPAIEWNDRLLVDGGVLDNVPTQAAYQLGARRLLAVDVGGVVGLQIALADVGTFSKRLERLLYWVLDLSQRERTFDTSIRATMLSQQMLTRYELSLYPPDILIQPDIPDIGIMAFERMVDTIAPGEQAARDSADRIRAIMRRPNVFPRHEAPRLPDMERIDE